MAGKKNKQQTKELRPVFLALIVIVVGALALVVLSQNDSEDFRTTRDSELAEEAVKKANESVDVPPTLAGSQLVVNYTQASIPLDQILSGGPGKDGIPAITEPSFVQLTDSDVADTVQVMVVENNGETKLYPYSVLVWHEIVNDTVGEKPLAITFCPLCGSAIVFERDVDGDILDFGVSGFLFESNLLMYSREDSESLWSQSRGEAVVGDRTGTKLTHHPTQVITFGQAKSQFPNATVMSTNTGYSRDYESNPYGGYDEDDSVFFPVSVNDNRFPAKEVFYIVPLEGNSIAVRQNKDDGTYDVPDTDIKVTFDRGQITAKWGDAVLPGYFEMWFSWATHNQENGIVLD